MTTTQATVETLTAEVRVLMVGNRQITQSVVKQLDRTQAILIEPMGRINLPGESHLVIGRYRLDGSLRVASYRELPSPLQEFIPHIVHDQIGGKIYVNDPELRRRPLVLDGQEFTVDRTLIADCICTDRPAASSWHYPDPDEIKFAIQPDLQRHENLLAIRESMESLPLIVLAGLR